MGKARAPSSFVFVAGPVAMAIVAVLGACTDVPKADFASPEPGARNAAIVEVAARGDQSARVHLVQMLESDDPATRLLAISTLQRLTDQTFGYDYALPEVKRRPAIERWAAWAREQTSTPTPGN